MTGGYVPVPLGHFGGMVTSWPPEMLDVSVSPFAQNVRFTQGAVAVREGLSQLWKTEHPENPIIGLADLGPESGLGPLLATYGSYYWEAVRGSGVLASAGRDPLTEGYVNAQTIFGRAYMANADMTGVQGAAAPQHWDGANFYSVTPAVPAAVLEPGDSASAGNVAAGQRWVVCLFMMSDGSMFMAKDPAQWTASGGKEAFIQQVPVGPAGTVARVLAFTVAGGSSAGPYFYIGASQTVNGISETATTIEDNVTTVGTFNFDDDFLGSSTDVTEYFDQTTLPDEAGVAYSQLTGRLMWWGEPGQPSLLRFSEAADGGLYLGDVGFVLVADGDGTRITGAFEFRGGLYCVKERGLYRITPNNGDPATWTVSQISATVGCSGPRAFAVQNEFVIMVSRGGIHLFTGGPPQTVSDELLGPAPDAPGLWQQINWTASGTIWAHVDHDSKTVRIGIPLNQSAVPSHILKLSYLDGWEPSIRFSVFTARYHYFPGRRYSLDTIGATGCYTIERTQAHVPWAFDSREATRQIVLPSSANLPVTGAPGAIVSMLDANSPTDLGTEIEAVYRTGAVSAAQKLQFQRSGLEMVGLVQARARGDAHLELWAVSGLARRRIGAFNLADGLNGDRSALALMGGENVNLELRSTGGRWTCNALYCYARPWMALRPGAARAGAQGGMR